jgi:hypothetical protein
MSIGVNLLVSKFRIVPSQCWRYAPFDRATRPKRNQVPQLPRKRAPIRFHRRRERRMTATA